MKAATAYAANQDGTNPLIKPVAIGAAICLVLYLMVMGSTGEKEIVYGCMMDAGSTGSRIHVYKFEREKGGPLRILDEIFEQVKPGVSSYAKNPPDAGKSLQPLLDIAMSKIPKELHSQTPIALYASAGLRLIDAKASNHILEEIRNTIAASPFKFERSDASIISGKMEGVFAWITVNFLLHNLDKGSSRTTSGIIDLGGGSTQIVYEASSLKGIPEANTHALMMGGRAHHVYVHSYLGYGLMEGTKTMLRDGAEPAADSAEQGHPCLPTGYKTQVPNANIALGKIALVGTAGSSNSRACIDIAKKSLHKEKPCSPAPCGFNGVAQPSVGSMPFYAFSYFFDRSQQVGFSATTSVGAFGKAAASICGLSMEQVKSQYGPKDKDGAEATRMCMDMSFLHALIEHGYGFSPSSKLTIAKKIDGYETAWALGAMIEKLG